MKVGRIPIPVCRSVSPWARLVPRARGIFRVAGALRLLFSKRRRSSDRTLPPTGEGRLTLNAIFPSIARFRGGALDASSVSSEA